MSFFSCFHDFHAWYSRLDGQRFAFLLWVGIFSVLLSHDPTRSAHTCDWMCSSSWQVAAKSLEAVKDTPTERSSKCTEEQIVDRTVRHVAAYAPQRRKKKNQKKLEILVAVSYMYLDDFVALLVDSDVHMSTDAMWDAIDSVVPGGDSISPQQQVQVA